MTDVDRPGCCGARCWGCFVTAAYCALFCLHLFMCVVSACVVLQEISGITVMHFN
jgi:hypothetical protein